MRIQYSGMTTTASQSHPAVPPSQLRRRVGGPVRRCRWTVWVRAGVVRVALMSCAFQLARCVASAEPAQQQGETEAHQHEDDRDRAGRAHQVGLEAPLVHVQREYLGGLARSAL